MTHLRGGPEDDRLEVEAREGTSGRRL